MNSSIVHSASPVVVELLKAVGLDDLDRIAGVNIDIQAGQLAKVVVGFYVQESQIQAVAAILKERELYLAEPDGSKAKLSDKEAGQEISNIAHLLESSYKKAPALAEAA